MKKNFIIALFLLCANLISVHAASDLLEGKSEEFIKYHRLGLDYLKFMDNIPNLDEEGVREGVNRLFSETLDKIENGSSILSRDTSPREALFQQLMGAKTRFGKWELRLESYRIVPSPEIMTTVAYFVGEGSGGTFNTMVMLTFDAADQITNVFEAFAPLQKAMGETAAEK